MSVDMFIKIEYVPQKNDGSAMAAVQMAWNIAVNKGA